LLFIATRLLSTLTNILRVSVLLPFIFRPLFLPSSSYFSFTFSYFSSFCLFSSSSTLLLIHLIPPFSTSPFCRAVIANCFMLVSCSPYFSTPKMEATCSSETSVEFHRITRRYIPGDKILHNHRCDNLKSYVLFSVFILLCHFLYSPPSSSSHSQPTI
jgi:hypothetical protein